MRMIALRGWCLIGLFCFQFMGCSAPPPKREYGEVTGKVTYKGEPLKLGTVTFQPATGAAVSAEIKSDGTYQLQGVIGPNIVMISSREPDSPASGDPAERQKAKSSGPKSFIPNDYNSPQAGLKFDVKAGSNKADFELK